jgi:hypothetical protein
MQVRHMSTYRAMAPFEPFLCCVSEICPEYTDAGLERMQRNARSPFSKKIAKR